MNLFTAIEKRHSYRGAYTKARVPRSALRRIVAAGLKAPSGCNAQTTTFVIVDDPRKMAVIRTLHPMTAIRQAHAIIACVVHKKAPPTFHGRDSFEVEDCAAAIENMLLAITALGYGSVWIDGYLRERGRASRLNRLLRVPRNRTVRVMLPIGVPAEKVRRPEKKPFGHRAWFNRHG
ncbi:MAG: nitroreductase family protein [Candidatus Coatesbacteria bacterium]